MASIPYYLVEIWEEIDEEFKDIFLMHELAELRHRVRGKQSRNIAHSRAERAHEKYMKRYFSPDEIERFHTMLEDLPKRREKKSRVMVLGSPP